MTTSNSTLTPSGGDVLVRNLPQSGCQVWLLSPFTARSMYELIEMAGGMVFPGEVYGAVHLLDERTASFIRYQLSRDQKKLFNQLRDVRVVGLKASDWETYAEVFGFTVDEFARMEQKGRRHPLWKIILHFATISYHEGGRRQDLKVMTLEEQIALSAAEDLEVDESEVYGAVHLLDDATALFITKKLNAKQLEVFKLLRKLRAGVGLRELHETHFADVLNISHEKFAQMTEGRRGKNNLAEVIVRRFQEYNAK